MSDQPKGILWYQNETWHGVLPAWWSFPAIVLAGRRAYFRAVWEVPRLKPYALECQWLPDAAPVLLPDPNDTARTYGPIRDSFAVASLDLNGRPNGAIRPRVVKVCGEGAAEPTRDPIPSTN